MSTLDELLRQFQSAQRNIYNYLGISRQLPSRADSDVAILRHKHVSGSEDIPTAYPEILDYRGKEWRQASSRPSSDDEIHVKLQSGKEWELDNTVRFNILTIWVDNEASTVCAVCNHLPKPDELYFAHPEAIERVRRGINFYGDSCLLILSPKFRPNR